MSREQPETTSEVATVPGKGKTRNSFGNMVWTKHESKVLQGKLVERRSCTCRSPGRFGSFYLETCLSNRACYCQLSLAKHELSGPVLQSSCLDRRCWRFLQRSLFCQGIASGCGGVRAMTSLLQQIGGRHVHNSLDTSGPQQSQQSQTYKTLLADHGNQISKACFLRMVRPA